MEESPPAIAQTRPARTTVLASGGRSEPNPDEALRAAIKAAVDAGDFERVKALVAVLEASPKVAPVLVLAKPARR